MREICTYGSEGGAVGFNRLFLPLSIISSRRAKCCSLVGRTVSAVGIVRVIMIETTVPVKSRMKMIYSHKSFEETPDVGYSRLNGLVGRTVSADAFTP